MRLGQLLTAIAAVALLLPAGAAAAPGGSLPSEGSALDQYVESVPDGKGGRPSTDVASSGGGGGGSSSSGAAIGGDLAGRGSDGAAAARLAAATAPGPGSGGDDSGSGDGGSGSGGSGGSGSGGAGSGGGDSTSSGKPFALEAAGTAGDESAGDAVGSLLGDDSDAGLGVALPVILLATLLVALATAALRHRRERNGEKTP